MRLQPILLLAAACLFTSCVPCVNCGDCKVDPSRNVTVSLTADSLSGSAYLQNLVLIIEARGQSDTLRPSVLGPSSGGIGFRRDYGSSDSLKLSLIFKDSLVYTATYPTPVGNQSAVRFYTDTTGYYWNASQAISLDSTTTIYHYFLSGLPACQ